MGPGACSFISCGQEGLADHVTVQQRVREGDAQGWATNSTAVTVGAD